MQFNGYAGWRISRGGKFNIVRDEYFGKFEI